MRNIRSQFCLCVPPTNFLNIYLFISFFLYSRYQTHYFQIWLIFDYSKSSYQTHLNTPKLSKNSYYKKKLILNFNIKSRGGEIPETKKSNRNRPEIIRTKPIFQKYLMDPICLELKNPNRTRTKQESNGYQKHKLIFCFRLSMFG